MVSEFDIHFRQNDNDIQNGKVKDKTLTIFGVKA